MKTSAYSSFCREGYDIKPFFVATFIAFNIIIVGFFSYVGYRSSYDKAINEMSIIIEREVDKYINTQMSNQVTDIVKIKLMI